MLDMLRFSRKPYKVGLVLRGGGARAFAHAGALTALAELSLKHISEPTTQADIS